MGERKFHITVTLPDSVERKEGVVNGSVEIVTTFKKVLERMTVSVEDKVLGTQLGSDTREYNQPIKLETLPSLPFSVPFETQINHEPSYWDKRMGVGERLKQMLEVDRILVVITLYIKGLDPIKAEKTIAVHN